jgi:hypothetical protein
MMNEKDLKEYHNLEKQMLGIKLNNKYNYIQGKQITDHESGTRVYEVNNSRLPSVTTILGATKNQQFSCASRRSLWIGSYITLSWPLCWVY